MTEYAHLPQATALHYRRELVSQIISLIDTGGYVSQFAVSPRPAEAGEVAPAELALTVLVPADTASPEMLASARAWCVQQQADIDMQLADLGIINPPERKG